MYRMTRLTEALLDVVSPKKKAANYSKLCNDTEAEDGKTTETLKESEHVDSTSGVQAKAANNKTEKPKDEKPFTEPRQFKTKHTKCPDCGGAVSELLRNIVKGEIKFDKHFQLVSWLCTVRLEFTKLLPRSLGVMSRGAGKAMVSLLLQHIFFQTGTFLRLPSR